MYKAVPLLTADTSLRRALPLAGLALYLALPLRADALEPADRVESSDRSLPRLSASYGRANIFDDEGRTAGYGIELALGPYTRWALSPMFGIATTEHKASFFYAGLRRPFWLGEHWVLTPSFAAGVFERGNEMDLGNPLEFRSGAELARRLDNDVRIGLGLYHISNGGLSERNPGTELLSLSVSIPLDLR
jgi:hypothetical protein